MNWVDTPTGRHCTRHSLDFARGIPCPGCITDPGEKPGEVAESSAIDDALMRAASEHERLAKKCHRVGEDLLDGTSIDVAAAVKAIAEGTKLARFVFELRDSVSNRQHERDQMAHERDMAGLRGAKK